MINEKKLKTMRLILASLKEKWLDPYKPGARRCAFCYEFSYYFCAGCTCPRTICFRNEDGDIDGLISNYFYPDETIPIKNLPRVWIQICRTFQREYLKLKAEVGL
jgi:hypothetical protein